MLVWKELVLRGKPEYTEEIDAFMRHLNCERSFEIRLILTEAVSNAVIHGNCNQCACPVLLRGRNSGEIIEIQVADSRRALSAGILRAYGSHEPDLSEEHGRGIFLIHQLADSVCVVDGVLSVVKKLNT